MNLEGHWNTELVGMGEYGFLEEPGLLYTEGLGPCIGLCLAYGCWAGIIHSSHPPHDEEEIRVLITRAKSVIPAEEIHLVHPVLCGSDPSNHGDEFTDAEEYEADRMEARRRIVEILEDAGFGDPHLHWCDAGQTAAVFADLENSKVFAEVDGDDFEYPIFQG